MSQNGRDGHGREHVLNTVERTSVERISYNREHCTNKVERTRRGALTLQIREGKVESMRKDKAHEARCEEPIVKGVWAQNRGEAQGRALVDHTYTYLGRTEPLDNKKHEKKNTTVVQASQILSHRSNRHLLQQAATVPLIPAHLRLVVVCVSTRQVRRVQQ